MTMRLLHAFAAILTVLLFFIRQRSVVAAVFPAKRRAMDLSARPCGDTSFTAFSVAPQDMMYARTTSCRREQVHSCQPKYKRDPDISVDNENIGQHPHD